MSVQTAPPVEVAAHRGNVAIVLLEKALAYRGEPISVVFLEGAYGWLELARYGLTRS